MRKTLLVATASLGLLGGLALPANAADTTTTFSLTAGAFSISAPGSANLGSGAVGTARTAALGNVTVNDNRGTLLGGWTATVVSSDFTTGQASVNETIAKTNVTYWSGASTATTGTALRVPGQATALLAAPIGSATTAFSATGALGANVTTWAPTVIVTPPAATVIGDYTGTIIHSVA